MQSISCFISWTNIYVRQLSFAVWFHLFLYTASCSFLYRFNFDSTFSRITNVVISQCGVAVTVPACILLFNFMFVVSTRQQSFGCAAVLFCC
jgi:hypothetical protein